MNPANPRLPILLVGGISTLLYAAMASVSREYADATLAHASWVYVPALVLCATLAVWLGRIATPVNPAQNVRVVAAAARLASPVTWVIGFAVVFRLLGVLSFPVLEDDFYRYLWDGRMLIETGSPYLAPPASYFAADLPARFSDILDAVNYPEVATVYGPTLQLLFAGSYLLAPGSVWPLQLFAALADLGVLVLIAHAFNPVNSRTLALLLMYAWSPLLIKEFATTAHPDMFGALLILLAAWVIRSHSAGRTSSRLRSLLCGVLLALAVGVKPFALVVVPFLLGLRAMTACGFVGGLVALTLPFLATTPWQLVWFPEGLQVMSGDWAFNAMLHSFGFRLAGIGLQTSSAVLLAAFAGLWLWQYLRFLRQCAGGLEENRRHTGVEWLLRHSPVAWLTGVFLLVVPVLNPWYLAWWLPFVVGRAWVTPWVASFAVWLSYFSAINFPGSSLVAHELGLYGVPLWALILEASLIACALAFDVHRARSNAAHS